jgi:ATP-dependent RNA helicase DeaD
MLRGARIAAEWVSAPTPEQIRHRDRDRLMTILRQPVEADDEDRELAGRLMAELDAEIIATALVKALRTDLPAPEDMLDQSARSERSERDDGPRPGFENSTWFRINVGRQHKADPRWLLPLICRHGHVGRADIGAIRIAAAESYFEVTGRAAPGFVKLMRKGAITGEDDGVVIVLAESGPGQQFDERRARSAPQKRHGPPPRRATIKPTYRRGK